MSDLELVEVDDQTRTSVENIFAIGDIVAGPRLAHKASYEAQVAAEDISGEKSAVDYLCIPAVCFTVPELAPEGLSEACYKVECLVVQYTKFIFVAFG